MNENLSSGSQGSTFNRFVYVYIIALLISGIGIIVGQFVPIVLMIPLVILEIVLMIMVVLARGSKMGYSLMYSFVFISGITMYVVIDHYVSAIGGKTVTGTFIVAVIMFISIAIYATKTNRNFGFLGKTLFFILIGLFGVSLVGIFVPFSSTLELIVSVVGVLLFSAYTLYDFNRIKHEGIDEDEIPSTVLNIYLDFINLFLYLLRFVASIIAND